jgi:hypothetical protein
MPDPNLPGGMIAPFTPQGVEGSTGQLAPNQDDSRSMVPGWEGNPNPQSQVRTKYEPEYTHENPSYTVPEILGKQTRGYWSGNEQQLLWTAGGTVDSTSVATTTWRSPIFDLRPDLRGSSGYSHNLSTPIFRGSAYGAGMRLMVQLNNIENLRLVLSTNWYCRELGHVLNDRRVTTLTEFQNITSDVYSGGTSAGLLPATGRGVVLVFSPLANPMRFWQVEIACDQGDGAVGVLNGITAWGVGQ